MDSLLHSGCAVYVKFCAKHFCYCILSEMHIYVHHLYMYVLCNMSCSSSRVHPSPQPHPLHPCYGSWCESLIHALMNCRDGWLPHLVFVCCSSSHCTSYCWVCDQLLFGSGHSSDNQRRERCSALLRMWVM